MNDIYIADLREAFFRVRVVRFGWRAIVASWLLRLGAWVGGSAIEFIGDKHG